MQVREQGCPGTSPTHGYHPPAMNDVHRRTIQKDETGLRLDVYLALALGVSRAEARRVLARGDVSLDGRSVGLSDKGAMLEAGCKLEVRAPRPPREQRPLPEPDAALEEVARGAGWVAVNKPAGVPVHPLAEDEGGTLLNALVARYPEVWGVGEGGLRSGVVHRLDVDTSGVMLFALAEGRFAELRGAFRRHRVEKCYRAVVHGHLQGEGALDVHLAVAQHRPARVRVVQPGEPAFARRTRRARLTWRTLQGLRGATLVEVRPVTGFLHQVRVSLAHIGHPLLGDTRYGAPHSEQITRHLLHASSVRYGKVFGEAPDAEDFAACLSRLG